MLCLEKNHQRSRTALSSSSEESQQLWIETNHRTGMEQFTYEHRCTSVFTLQTRARHRKSNIKATVKHYGFLRIHMFLSQTYFFEECFSQVVSQHESCSDYFFKTSVQTCTCTNLGFVLKIPIL